MSSSSPSHRLPLAKGSGASLSNFHSLLPTSTFYWWGFVCLQFVPFNLVTDFSPPPPFSSHPHILHTYTARRTAIWTTGLCSWVSRGGTRTRTMGKRWRSVAWFRIPTTVTPQAMTMTLHWFRWASGRQSQTHRYDVNTSHQGSTSIKTSSAPPFSPYPLNSLQRGSLSTNTCCRFVYHHRKRRSVQGQCVRW